MKKLLVLSLMILVAMFFLAGCGGNGGGDAGGGTTDAEEEVFMLRIGGTVPDEHPITIAMRSFADDLNERSGGRIEASVFPNNQVAAGRELFEGVQVGNLQMAENSIAVLAAFTEQYLPLSLPFLFPSREVAYAFADGPLGQELAELVAEETGMRVLAYFENGIRQVTNSTRPIVEPADFNGIKIRVMDSPIFIRMFEAMGAQPMPMSFAEVFTALQQGTIDAQDNPFTIVRTNNFYEVQSYITNLSHVFDFTTVVINDEFFQSLPADLQELLLDAMADATALQRELSIQAEQDNLAYLRDLIEVTELTPAERQAFRDVSEPVYDWFRETHGGEMLDRILAEIARLS